MQWKKVMFKKIIHTAVTASLTVMLSACASTGTETADGHINPDFIKIELPRVVTPAEQLNMVKLSQVLGNTKLNHTQVSVVMWHRAELYNRMGLDFLSVLSLLGCVNEDNQNSDCYRDYGGALYSHGKFLEAYDALDGALELSPKDNAAHFSRGLALYYGKREKMAEEDFYKVYLSDRQDPYFQLWLFYAEYASDPEKAGKNLLSRYRMINVKDLSFGTRVLEVYLNIRSEKDLWDHIFDGTKNYIERNERLCEAYFYMGKMHLMNGETTRALDYFKLARTTNVSYFLEHSNALLEIHMLDTENEYDDIGFDEKMVNSEAGTPQ